jgi:cytochrome P450
LAGRRLSSDPEVDVTHAEHLDAHDDPSSTAIAQCPFADITNVADPWTQFALLRSEGIKWDDSAAGWVVPDYAGVKEVFADEELFVKPQKFRDIWGRSHLISLEGEEHKRVRRWWQSIFTPKQAEVWRTTIVRPVVDSTLDRFTSHGRAELVSEYAKHVSIKVIAAIVGLPWQDDEWLAEYRRGNDAIKEYMFANPFGSDAAAAANAQANRHKMNELLAPSVEQRRLHPTDDVISRLWADGPDLLPDWSEEDVFDTVRNIFFGGTDTTKHALCNAVAILVKQPELVRELQDGDSGTVARFVEESLRVNPLVQFRARIAGADTMLGDKHITKGDLVYAVVASGNRDADRYEHADDVDLDRKTIRDHVAFGFGPTMCLGAPLARVELQEMVGRLLHRVSDIELEDGVAPMFTTGHLRAYEPLPVSFRPRQDA